MTSDDRLKVLRTKKHSVGISRFDEASHVVSGMQHARIFSSKSGLDTTAPAEVLEVINQGASVFASFKSTNVEEVKSRARFFNGLTLLPGQFIIDCHYHEPEDLSATPDGARKWFNRQVEFANIMHSIAPNVIWACTFTGEPGLEYDEDKPKCFVDNFLPPNEYPWLDLIGVDRYVHNVVRRTPQVAWAKILADCGTKWNRPLFIAEFGVEGTAQQRADYVRAHSEFVKAQRAKTNKGKRILGSTWFHSPVGRQAPMTADGTRTWAINKSSDLVPDPLTPLAWEMFAREYGRSGTQ